VTEPLDFQDLEELDTIENLAELAEGEPIEVTRDYLISIAKGAFAARREIEKYKLISEQSLRRIGELERDNRILNCQLEDSRHAYAEHLSRCSSSLLVPPTSYPSYPSFDEFAKFGAVDLAPFDARVPPRPKPEY